MLEQLTGIVRPTKDFDLHVRQEDLERIFATLDAAGYRTEMTFSHWLGKVLQGTYSIDVIFSSGNGVCKVDDEWFANAICGEVLDVRVKFCAPEEAIWSKAFIMERERYDGADVAHLFFARAHTMDWRRLLRRFGPYWQVLLNHLVLFSFIYPARSHLVPEWLLVELWRRWHADRETGSLEPICQGTLLSRTQYLYDVTAGGLEDARLKTPGAMTPDEIERWTQKAMQNS
ncbi:MAG: hypothetical protein ACREQV_12300 [Candidatus Binatia bacterium]